MSVPRHLRMSDELSVTRVTAASGVLAAILATPPSGVARHEPVLAVPGYTGSKEDFLHLLPLLAQRGYPVTAIDLRGQHESGGPEDPEAYRIDALAADITALLADSEPAHVLAHSFGGLVCRAAVIDGAPARSLTLLGSGPAALGGTRGQLIELMQPLLTDGGVPAVWEASEAISAADPKRTDISPEVREFLRRRFLASPDAALLGMGIAVTTAPDRVAELRETQIPVLVAHGEADDAWTPAEQQEMAEQLGARYHVLNEAGHSPAVDTPEATAAVLDDFWTSIRA
jgi:pimeloyl-ACP methyl ester carboxylesterase